MSPVNVLRGRTSEGEDADSEGDTEVFVRTGGSWGNAT